MHGHVLIKRLFYHQSKELPIPNLLLISKSEPIKEGKDSRSGWCLCRLGQGIIEQSSFGYGMALEDVVMGFFEGTMKGRQGRSD